MSADEAYLIIRTKNFRCKVKKHYENTKNNSFLKKQKIKEILYPQNLPRKITNFGKILYRS